MSKTTIEQRFGVATAIGISGALVAQAIVQVSPLVGTGSGFCRCAAAGAFVAGFALASGFGRAGLGGWVLAAFSFLGATLIGATIAVLFMPFETFIASLDVPQVAVRWIGSAVLGPVYVLEMMTSSFGVLLPWVGSVLGIHLLAQYWRDQKAA